MDFNVFLFFIALSVILFIVSLLTYTAWLQLSFGWIAGGILIVVGYLFANGETLTTTTVIATTANNTVQSVDTIMSLGVSSENMFIIMALLGIVMIFSSSGDWI
jgi:hypothetical protein